MEEKRLHFKVVQFIMEAGTKLQLKSIPVATACLIYQKFFYYSNTQDYDPYLIATSSLYLASKVEEDHVKLRDVVNVTYRCLHPDKPPLDIGTTYWQLRESIAQCELFILRVLNFQVSFTHPHKYLLHYLKSLLSWLDPATAHDIPVANTSWAILRDSYHGRVCLKHPPDKVAVSVLYLALQVHGVQVPYSEEAEERWWEAFVENMKMSEMRAIIGEIIEIYNMENIVA